MKVKLIVLLALFGGASFASAGTGAADSHSLALNGSEYKAPNVTHGNLNHRIYPTGSSSGSFTNIPEAASAALGLLGAILLLRRRR